MISKDRQIGVSNRTKQNQSTKVRPKLNLNQLDQIANQLDNIKIQRLKKTSSVHQQRNTKQLQKSNESKQISNNKWDCIKTFQAHNTPVLSTTMLGTMLITTASKSLKLWDIQTCKVISQLSSNSNNSNGNLSGPVQFVIADPDNQKIITATDKIITFWDICTMSVTHSLKAHKDKIKTLHLLDNVLFSGGKGLPNSGSLLIWDLRKLDSNKPLQQKQKNQDIFTFASNKSTLYYGTRNHHVRRMDLSSYQILTPFQPPHMDSVTGLTVLGNKLISGSKDKNLRLWDLQNTIGSLKNTVHGFNDYVTNIISNENANFSNGLFYAGSKDGQIKIGNTLNDRINFIGNIMAHSQSINSLNILQDNQTLISASADKTIKIWKPNIETIQNLKKQDQ